MSNYETVAKSIYDDLEAVSRDAFDLYLWSFINHRCNLAGLYSATERAMLESKVPARALKGALGELAERKHMFHADGLVWVKARIKRLPTRGPKVAQPIFRTVASVDAKHPLRVALIFHYCHELPGKGEDFGWLSPLLQTLDVVPHTEGDLIPEYDSSDESSAKRDESVCMVSTEETPDFKEWLEHHARTTGETPPKPGTKARQSVAAAFAERVAEDYSLDDLKAATEGAYNDSYRREHGYFGCVSVLRPKKVHELVQKGRRGNVTPLRGADAKLAEIAQWRRELADEPEDAA